PELGAFFRGVDVDRRVRRQSDDFHGRHLVSSVETGPVSSKNGFPRVYARHNAGWMTLTRSPPCGDEADGIHPCVTSADHPTPATITTKESPRSFDDTVNELLDLIAARGMKVFVVIDQAAEARAVGLQLRPTTLIVFGSPVAGTAVMAAAPLSALDLPLKVLIWADGDQTKVSYLGPGALADRYHLDSDLAHNLAGIDPLTDALVAP
ncbi:MAG: DUF302 domain-containing protein, partial [Acidimicrobiales bacterium]